MDIKDFILIVGGILMAAVVAHGAWIAWRGRNEQLPIVIMTDPVAPGAPGANDVAVERHRWEFPNGGARVARDDLQPTRRDGPKQRSFVLDEPLPPARESKPMQAAALRREMDAELLGRSVQGAASPVSRDLFEPAVDATADSAVADGDEPRSEFAETDQLAAERAGIVEVTLPPEETTLVTENRQAERGRVHNPPPAANQPLSDEEEPAVTHREAYAAPTKGAPTKGAPTKVAPAEAATPSADVASDEPAEPEDIIVLYLLAPEGERFAGNVICTSLMQHGLKFGDKNLFHRMQTDQAKPIFSVVNIVQPGFFDLAAIEDMSTPGIAFYMALPGPEDPLAAFDDMVRIAQRLCGAVQGRLMDDSRSMITMQTISHLRERVTGVHLRNYSRRA